MKTCPRCNRRFTCRSDDIKVCACRTLELDAQQRAYIHSHYQDCLCVHCLRALRDDYDRQHPGIIFPP